MSILFSPKKQTTEEQNKDEKLLLQEVVNDQPKKINTKRTEEYIYSFEPPKFTD